MKKLFTTILATVTLSTGVAHATGPYQLIARGYTEVLGRKPDVSGYNAHMNAARTQTCNTAWVKNRNKAFLNSSEFNNRSDYSNYEKILVAYRMITGGDTPNVTERDNLASDLDDGILTWSQAIDQLNNTYVTTALTNKVCNNQSIQTTTMAKQNDWVPALREAAHGSFGNNSTTFTALKNEIEGASSGTTIWLTQGATFDISDTITIPAGVVVRTYDEPDTKHYALMARLRATSSLGSKPMFRTRDGGALMHVWLDGNGANRGWKGAAPIIDAKGMTGTGGFYNTFFITANKMSDTAGNSSVQLFGEGESASCDGQVYVTDNIITSYDATHYVQSQYTDGVRTSLCKVHIENNTIIDATDVGVVVFRVGPANSAQNTIVKNNAILQAGNDAYGGVTIDQLHNTDSIAEPTGGHNFTGTEVYDNQFGSAPGKHFDTPWALGVRSWFGNNTDDAFGAKIYNNKSDYTIYEGQTSGVVGGMRNGAVYGNDTDAITVKKISNLTHTVQCSGSTCANPTSGIIEDYFSSYHSGTTISPAASEDRSFSTTGGVTGHGYIAPGHQE